MKLRPLILSLLSAFVFLGCEEGFNSNDDGDKVPTVISECAAVGAIDFVMTSPVPENVKVNWNGGTFNECTDENSVYPPLEVSSHKENTLTSAVGGFVLTLSNSLNMEIFDLGDCSGGETKIFELIDFQTINGEPELCEGFQYEFFE